MAQMAFRDPLETLRSPLMEPTIPNANAEGLQALVVDVLDDEDPAIQYAAAESLEASSGLDLGGNIRLWKDLLAGEITEKQALQNRATGAESYFDQLINSGITIGDLMPWNWF